jgi:hypothetical protein
MVCKIINSPREHFVYLLIFYFYIRLNALSTHNGLSPDHVDHGSALFTVIFILRINITLNVTKFDYCEQVNS